MDLRDPLLLRLWPRARLLARVVLVGMVVWGLSAPGGRAQSADSRGTTQEVEGRFLPPLHVGPKGQFQTSRDAIQGLDLRRDVTPRPPLGQGAQRTSSPFGSALVGSAIGTAVGVPLGVLMIRGAGDDSVWEERSKRSDNNCCGLQRLGVGLLGVTFVGGGGPFGAATRLNSKNVETLVPSVSGELLLGGLGFAIGSKLGGDGRHTLSGLVVGIPLAALGAAVGAVWGAGIAGGEVSSGALRRENGKWRIGLPSVHVWSGLGSDRRGGARVSLISVRL